MTTGLMTWSQVPASNATADSNINWAEGMAPSQVNDSARAVMASAAKWRDDLSGTNVTSGSSAAHTLNTNQICTALTSGYTVSFRFGFPTNTNATLAVDGLAAVPLQIYPGTNLSGQEFQAGSIGSFTYSSTGTGQWILQTPPVHTALTKSLTSNVALADTANFFTGPAVTQGTSGVWFASGHVTVRDASAPIATFTAKLWDGTTVAAASVQTNNASSQYCGTIHLAGVFVNPVGNIRISVRDATNLTGFIVASDSGTLTDSSITAIRIG